MNLNPFERWDTCLMADECRAQERQQLDPDFSRLMAAMANRLDRLAEVVEASKGCLEVLNALDREGTMALYQSARPALDRARQALASVLP